MARKVRLDQRRADAREGIQHDACPRPRQVTGQGVLNELPGKARDPGNPPVHRRPPIGHEGGVAEGPALGSPAVGDFRRPVTQGRTAICAFTPCADCGLRTETLPVADAAACLPTVG